MIHGKYLVGEEFILNFNLLQSLCSYVKKIKEYGKLN